MPDASFGQRLGLAQLGAANAHGPGRNLSAGDLGAFVCLGMRTQFHAGTRAVRHHGLDVSLEAFEVDNKGRGRQRGSRSLGANQVRIQCVQVSTRIERK